MGDVGGTKVDEFEWIGFKHETQELLIRFRFQHDEFPIEAFVQEDFIRWKVTKAGVSQDQAIVDIPNVSDKEVVVGEDCFEVDGPDLFADGHHHQT